MERGAETSGMDRNTGSIGAWKKISMPAKPGDMKMKLTKGQITEGKNVQNISREV